MGNIVIVVSDDFKAQFVDACKRQGRTLSDVLRELAMKFVIDNNPSDTTRMCPTCNKPIRHKNETMPYCSHSCANIYQLPEGFVRHGAYAVANTGAKARINVHSTSSKMGHCQACAMLIKQNVLAFAPPNQRFCLRCVVLEGSDYSALLESQEFDKPDDMLEYIKQGGVLDETAD